MTCFLVGVATPDSSRSYAGDRKNEHCDGGGRHDCDSPENYFHHGPAVFPAWPSGRYGNQEDAEGQKGPGEASEKEWKSP